MASRLRPFTDNDLLLYDERTGAILGMRTNAPDSPSAMFAGAPISLNGSPLVGHVLTASIAAGWRNQGGNWTRNGQNIPGATSPDYELQDEDDETDVTYVSTNLSAFFIPVPLRITRRAEPPVAPVLTPAVILAAPSSRSVEPGEEFVLVFVAVNALTLGWQVASASGAFSDIVGETDAQYTAGPLQLSHSGRRYRGFAVGPDGVRRYTEEAVITVEGGVVVPDSKARFGYGSSNAAQTDPAALLASMAVASGATNASRSGTFTGAPPPDAFVWVAIEAGVSAAGATFSTNLGPGGFQGTDEPGGDFYDDPAATPFNTSSVTAVINGVTWRFFRSNYANAAATWTIS